MTVAAGDWASAQGRGAMLPVAISIPAEVGLAVAGMVALAAQTVFVARLLMEPRSR